MQNNTDIPFCCYCGQQIKWPLKYTVEHLVPKSKGGNNTLYNKRPCCHVCNCERGNSDLIQYLTKCYHKSLNPNSNKYLWETKMENIKYLLHYINTAGEKLYKNKAPKVGL